MRELLTLAKGTLFSVIFFEFHIWFWNCSNVWYSLVFFLFYQKTESALLIETIFYINNGQLKSFRMLNSPQLYSSAPLEQSTSLSHHQSDGKHSPLLQDVKLSAHAVSEIGKCILLDMHIHQWGTTIKKNTIL